MTVMHVHFSYEASVLGHRKRNPVEKQYMAVEPVEVREVSGQDAPVAMRFKASRYFDQAPGQELELRWEGGKLWRPAFKVEGNPRTNDDAVVTRQGVDWLEDCAKEGYAGFGYGDLGSPFPTGYRNWRSEALPKPIEEDTEVAKVPRSQIDVRRAEIRAAAEKLLIVDGVPHVTCPEPVYSLSHDRTDGWWVQAALLGDRSSQAGHERTFRADELDWMKESMRISTIPEEDLIEVLIPEAVRYDGPGQLVIQSTESALQWMRKAVADKDVNFFVAYAALRDGLTAELAERAKAESPDPDALNVVELARNALAAMAGEEGFYHDRLDRALERIDARSLSADVAFRI